MKNGLLLFIVLSIGACSGKPGNDTTAGKNEPVVTIDDVRSNWLQLTLTEGRWVIYEPCDAANLNLHWSGDTLVVDWGQMATQDVIKRLEGDDGIFTLEGIDLSSDPPQHKFRIEPIDSTTGMAHWWLPNESEPRLLILESKKNNYPTVREKCDESQK